MPRETYDSFKDALGDREDVFFFPTRVEPALVYGVYLTTKANHDEVDTLFNSMHFVRIDLDNRASGTVDEAIVALHHQAEECEHTSESLRAEFSALSEQERGKFLAARSYLRYQDETFDVRRYSAQTKDNFYLVGWVPEDQLPEMIEHFSKCEHLSYVVDEPMEIEDLKPPTKLKNGVLSQVFRPFLEMYGLPAYNEIDPSPFMAFTYCLFAGIMFGDIGQGIVLILSGWALWHFKKAWLGRIIGVCGVSSTVFGIVYGSVFGFEDFLPGFKALEGQNVIYLLVASMGLGVLMIFIVMLFNCVNGVRQHNFEKWLFGPNGICGMLFYFGLIGAALCKVANVADLFVPAFVLPVLVLPLILMLLREPLSKLLAREPDWKPESLGSLLVGGFFELFETLLSYLTNTLSFMRIGAYAITHVGLMMVIKMMAGANLNPIVLVIGNVFVIGFEGMLVGIQVLRLEFYELFGRFYDDGGREYTPKIIDYSARNA